MKRIKFPYGLSNLEQLITQDYVWVDKTPYLEELEYQKFVSFLRPRRFGKSLFLSVLEYYYDLKRADKFETLFGNTYIGKKPTTLANSFRVLKLDFSGIDTRSQESAESGFTEKVRNNVSAFLKYYELFDKEIQENILEKKSAAAIILALFSEYHSQEAKIYLLIDEYDHFTNELLSQDLQAFRKAVSSNGYVRKFYENIKTATQSGVIDRFFITGVSPMTLDSLTSGFNIVTHLTHHHAFHNLMGFTEEEVTQLLDLVLEDKSRAGEVIKDMRDWYNGYRFSLEGFDKIYNSNMVLYFLQEFAKFQKNPRTMLDPNIMPDYGKLKAMFEVANYQDNLEVLQEVLDKGEVIEQQIYQFDFIKPFKRTDFVNFLYYLGNLTLKGEAPFGGEVARFHIPNYVIAELYWKYYAYILQERIDFEYDEDQIKKAIFSLMQSNEKPFFTLIENTLKLLSNRDYQRFDEKYIKMLIIAYAMVGNTFYILSERETKAGGYVDIEFCKRPNNTHQHTEYIFEVKYIKKDKEHTFEAIRQKAINQLKNYLTTDELIQSRELLRAFVLIFIKDSLLVEEVTN